MQVSRRAAARWAGGMQSEHQANGTVRTGGLGSSSALKQGDAATQNISILPLHRAAALLPQSDPNRPNLPGTPPCPCPTYHNTYRMTMTVACLPPRTFTLPPSPTLAPRPPILCPTLLPPPPHTHTLSR